MSVYTQCDSTVAVALCLSSRLAFYSKEELAFEDPSSTALVANKSVLIRDFAASDRGEQDKEP